MNSYQRLHDAIASSSLDTAFSSLYGENIDSQKERYLELLAKLEQELPTGDPFFVSAPGRTELGGNHTDHNRGRILAAAVDLDCVAAVSSNEKDEVTIHSAQLTDPVTIDLKDLSIHENEKGTPAALIRGMAAAFAEKGGKPRGFVAYLHATCHAGIGISSSAAFSVCIGAALAALDTNCLCSAQDLAKMAQRAENIHFGKPCGLMDQMASAVGQVISVDFKDPENPLVEKIDRELGGSGYKLALIDTGGSHTELTPEYAAIPLEMKAAAKIAGGRDGREISLEKFYKALPEIRKKAGDRAALRLLHFIEEDKRAAKMADYLVRDDFSSYLREVSASAESSFALLQNCSTITTTKEQGILLALALSKRFCPGTISRVHGGGFAGTVQVYIPEKELNHFAESMRRVFGANCFHLLRIGRPGVVILKEEGLVVPPSQ